MLDRNFFDELKKRQAAHLAARLEIIKLASGAQSAAKRAIFALHRDDAAEAEKLLKEAEAAFVEIGVCMAKDPGCRDEGAFRAALEEYVEARLYADFLRNGTVGAVKGEHIDNEIYLGALADLTGELQRRLVRLATEGKTSEVENVKDAIEAIVTELLAMDLTGYLRTKFDQAKNSLRRAEDVLYEVTLRRS